MMPTNYRTYVGGLVPAWLLGKWGGRLAATFALTCDMLGDTLLTAVESRYLHSAKFPDDALTYKGAERMIERVSGETAAQYKERVKGAWRAWTNAGTETAILEQIALRGITATIVYNHQWNWDGNEDLWSRFWVVITEPSWTRTVWGGGRKWADGSRWGSDASAAEIRGIRNIIRKWKPGHTYCERIIVVFDEDQWETDVAAMSGDWDRVYNRSPAAIYWEGTKAA